MGWFVVSAAAHDIMHSLSAFLFLPSHSFSLRLSGGTLFVQLRGLGIGVGTAGATGALAPRNAEAAGRKYLFAPAIICQVYLLVDSQSYISLYSFKILNFNLIMLFNWMHCLKRIR